ncbi:fibroblast growth factor 23-like isoform X1 [Lates japonicus]|uniref:Fibroblast growth factor 23-like isoform X1 n=1 Tax=Lates japonicus TaxID=270547 RepID=A0AAD3MVY8_LATJO|nr:fibroblast growth factor 23-like isoform X1 [Lates japonicus]
MQPAFFSLILTAVHVSVLVDCRPRLQDPEQLPQNQQSSSYTGAHGDTSAGTGRFYLELSGSMKRGIHRHFLVVLPVRTDTGNFVSIFDLRRKRFVCMASNGELYISGKKDKEDCLFQRIWLNLVNHHDMFYSTSGGRLLELEGAELRTVHQEPPEPSSAMLERFLGPYVRRQRRSEEVNPSDPLRSHSHPSHSAKDQKDTSHKQPEQDQAGAVSKETITSCDDPLRVLQPNGPVSPVKTNIADRAEQD